MLNQLFRSSMSSSHIMYRSFVDYSFALDIKQFVESIVELLIVASLITIPVNQPGIVGFGVGGEQKRFSWPKRRETRNIDQLDSVHW